MKKLPKIIVIAGQTATGKSTLAVELARKFNGEIISADSRQVYRGLDIGSGKITKKEMAGVPHHLLDVASPKKRFTVVNYKTLAEKSITEILSRKNIPIVCGGTGFYIDALVNGIVLPDVKPNTKLRNDLNRKTTDELFAILKKIDPARAKTVDPKNAQRVIRAIEVAQALGKVPKISKKKIFNALTIGLVVSKDELRKRINLRLTKRLKQNMVNEVKRLHQDGISWKRLEELGLEYRFVTAFLQKKLSRSEMVAKLQTEIYRFSKRQMTWFKHDNSINWFAPTQTSQIIKKISTFLK